MRRRGFFSLAWASLQDLFDQSTAFGRLALVHVIMMAGDTLVTVSLAGSLFFSVTPDAAKSKVLLYLVLTIAPFAVVSPLLGPLIDRSANGRRILVALAAMVRVVMCWQMSRRLNSLWLFPEAFVVLISSKLYGVTRGALVPEMARTDQMKDLSGEVGQAGWPQDDRRDSRGFAGFNAQLTLLGTLSGLVGGTLGAAVLKGLGAPSVLVLASLVFVGATVAALRLQQPAREVRSRISMSAADRDLQQLSPLGGTELTWGLSASALMRFAVGFASFLVAFGLRREHAGLGWYAWALAMSALGSLIGLALVTRLRTRIAESLQLTCAVAATGLGALIASRHPSLSGQIVFALWIGLWAAVAQPSFDSITQRLVPSGAQGRTFARFAVRQQLAWVVGALIPVAISLSFDAGDQFLGGLLLIGALGYALRGRVRHFG